jgi:hypothetical protein
MSLLLLFKPSVGAPVVESARMIVHLAHLEIHRRTATVTTFRPVGQVQTYRRPAQLQTYRRIATLEEE